MRLLNTAPSMRTSKGLECSLKDLHLHDLEQVLHIESQCYSHPWSRNNFLDSFSAKYLIQGLFLQGQPAPELGSPAQELIGYFVVMSGPEELHLLNLSVSPSYQRRGCARLMLDCLRDKALGDDRNWIWLEVRASNTGAIALYSHYGFQITGERKNYYPRGKIGLNQRENAVLMSYPIRRFNISE